MAKVVREVALNTVVKQFPHYFTTTIIFIEQRHFYARVD